MLVKNSQRIKKSAVNIECLNIFFETCEKHRKVHCPECKYQMEERVAVGNRTVVNFITICVTDFLVSIFIHACINFHCDKQGNAAEGDIKNSEFICVNYEGTDDMQK